jgi:transposase
MSESRGSGAEPPEGGGAPGDEQRRNWTASRKAEVVLRLLRGESLDGLAREYRCSAAQVSVWRDEFLAGGQERLRSRPGLPEVRALQQAQAKIGDLTMRLEIAEIALAKGGVVLPRRPGT